MSEPTKLQFDSFEVIKINIERFQNWKKKQVAFDVKHVSELGSKENSNSFHSYILVTAKGEEEAGPINLEVHVVGKFTIIGDHITNKERESFIHISSPAILFPYVRAFISSVTIQMNIEPIILPPVNFYAAAARQKEENRDLPSG